MSLDKAGAMGQIGQEFGTGEAWADLLIEERLELLSGSDLGGRQ